MGYWEAILNALRLGNFVDILFYSVLKFLLPCKHDEGVLPSEEARPSQASGNVCVMEQCMLQRSRTKEVAEVALKLRGSW